MTAKMSRLFNLIPYGSTGSNSYKHVVLTPQPTSYERVVAAWAYAVRYSAKGLDLPDYDAALEMLKQRHPSWEIIETTFLQVTANLVYADQDQPEA